MFGLNFVALSRLEYERLSIVGKQMFNSRFVAMLACITLVGAVAIGCANRVGDAVDNVGAAGDSFETILHYDSVVTHARLHMVGEFLACTITVRNPYPTKVELSRISLRNFCIPHYIVTNRNTVMRMIKGRPGVLGPSLPPLDSDYVVEVPPGGEVEYTLVYDERVHLIQYGAEEYKSINPRKFLREVDVIVFHPALDCRHDGRYSKLSAFVILRKP